VTVSGVSRRSALLGAAAGLLCAPLALASVPTGRRLVVMLLRGGMDGLGAVPAVGDPHYVQARGDAVTSGGLPLPDTIFALHPSLAPLMPMWTQGELAIVHATCGPYRDRSHFDAQNVLENGTERPFGADSGWLNRALVGRGGEGSALAAARSIPLLLRGPARTANADPKRPPRLDDGLLTQLQALYAEDPLLSKNLEEALSIEALVAQHRDPRRQDSDGMSTLGRVLSDEDGPAVAVLERGGWDTHTGQQNALERQLRELSEGLLALREGLGSRWSQTAVLVVTEFGRKVQGNGTGGTDHGVGGVALLLGGAVQGGQVVADWPGLGSSELLDQRDLRPTTDLRTIFAGVLHDHLQLDERSLTRDVFPSSSRVTPRHGLIRA
jgi:uncharacterized protein (DUF1501 family)